MSVMMTTEMSSEAVPSTGDVKQATGVIHSDDTQKYHDLGLGRGVNVTDPQMWRNKSSFLVRRVCDEPSNVIGTEECGMKEEYEKEVSTVAMHQQKIRLSLGDPSSQIKIGMDAHQSQSSSATKKITGTKVKTRTISFRVDFDDVLHSFSKSESESFEVPTYPQHRDNHFEISFYSWLLKCIQDRQRSKADGNSASGKEEDTLTAPLKLEVADELVEESPVAKLSRELKRLSPIELQTIEDDCKDFVESLGITHYVSTIKLGAMKYKVFAMSTKQTKLGAGAEVGTGHSVDGGLSGMVAKQWCHKSEEQQEIGKMSEDGKVKRNSPEEAVIGFQVQPIFKLIHVPYIQMILQKAIREYIQLKEDKSEGPFLISCEINKTTSIYWTVDEDDHVVMGTKSMEEASMFHIVPTQDPFHPSDFYIAYYGKEKNAQKKVTNVRINQQKREALPYYLSTNSNVFGYCSGPLNLKTTVLIQQARFSLHSRVQPSFAFMMCMSTPVTLSSWIEGEKFYINCSHRSFKVDGYIAMKQEVKDSRPTYKTITVPTMKDPSNNKGLGMLFRLHHPEGQRSRSFEKLPGASEMRCGIDFIDSPPIVTPASLTQRTVVKATIEYREEPPSPVQNRTPPTSQRSKSTVVHRRASLPPTTVSNGSPSDLLAFESRESSPSPTHESRSPFLDFESRESSPSPTHESRSPELSIESRESSPSSTRESRSPELSIESRESSPSSTRESRSPELSIVSRESSPPPTLDLHGPSSTQPLAKQEGSPPSKIADPKLGLPSSAIEAKRESKSPDVQARKTSPPSVEIWITQPSSSKSRLVPRIVEVRTTPSTTNLIHLPTLSKQRVGSEETWQSLPLGDNSETLLTETSWPLPTTTNEKGTSSTINTTKYKTESPPTSDHETRKSKPQKARKFPLQTPEPTESPPWSQQRKVKARETTSPTVIKRKSVETINPPQTVDQPQTVPSTDPPQTADQPQTVQSTEPPQTVNQPQTVQSTDPPQTANQPQTVQSTDPPQTADQPQTVQSTGPPQTADQPQTVQSTDPPQTADQPQTVQSTDPPQTVQSTDPPQTADQPHTVQSTDPSQTADQPQTVQTINEANRGYMSRADGIHYQQQLKGNNTRSPKKAKIPHYQKLKPGRRHHKLF